MINTQQQGKSQFRKVCFQKVFICATFICICERVCMRTHNWKQCNTFSCHNL